MTTEIQIERARPPAWEPSKLLLVSRVLDVVVGSAGVLLLLGSIVDCSGRSGKTVKGIKAGEYLVYPRVLRPATKLICMYQMEKGRLYSGLQDRNTRIRGNMLGLASSGDVLQHEVRISQQFNKAVKITMKQKLLHHCIIVSGIH